MNQDIYFAAIILLMDSLRLVDAETARFLFPDPIEIIDKGTRIFIKTDHGWLKIRSGVGNYFDQSSQTKEFLKDYPDLRVGEMIPSVQFWLSCFIDEDVPIELRQDSERLIAKTARQLVDNHTILIFDTISNKCVRPNEDVLKFLADGDRGKAVNIGSAEGVLNVSEPKSDQARKLALKDFVFGFAKPFVAARDKSQFFAKFKFSSTDGKLTEFMWIRVKDLQLDGLTGILDNDPISCKEFRYGQTVKCEIKDLYDWLYFEGETIHGNFLATLDSRFPIQKPPIIDESNEHKST